MKNKGKNKLSVAFLMAEEFPEPNGSFLLDQAVGMLNEDIEIKIFVLGEPPKDATNHPDIEKYKIMGKTTYLNVPRNKKKRIMRAVPIFVKNFLKSPSRTVDSFNFKKYGKMALTLNLLYAYDIFSKSKEKFDVIHCHFGHIGLIGNFLKKSGFCKKLIASFYGYDVNVYPKISGKNCYRNFFKNADCVTGNSEFIKHKLLDLGCDEGKIEIVPIGIKHEKFKPKPRKKHKKIILLTVARLSEEKGVEYAIKAASKISENFKYNIVGSGPLRKKLESLVEKLNLKKKVFFLGTKTGDSLVEQFQKADIFISPSIRAKDGSEEGNPMVNQEAQLMELPVISSNVGGIPFGLVDKETGFLVPEKDTLSITKKIKYLIRNPAAMEKMGKHGRTFVRDKFNTKKMYSKLHKIYTTK